MVFFPRSRLGRIVGAMLGALAGLGVVLVFLAWTGVYSIAASRGHRAIVQWFLTFGMRNSVPSFTPHPSG